MSRRDISPHKIYEVIVPTTRLLDVEELALKESDIAQALQVRGGINRKSQ